MKLFVWTAGDVFGIAFFLLIVLGVGIYYLVLLIQQWIRRSKIKRSK